MFNSLYKIIDTMKTIKKAVQSEINIKKSQFICCLYPTRNKKQSKEIIAKINQKYKATMNEEVCDPNLHPVETPKSCAQPSTTVCVQ